ncbi:MAG: galactose mutarotase [Oscillospiraceae bacterium]|nr:galactose mutarotase [Oscillospiraceae bacterium]
MIQNFGLLPSGKQASLYTITCGALTAKVTDFGATLVSLLVPDRSGRKADVVLGYDDAAGYYSGWAFLGATVGRNANRIKGGRFCLNGKTVQLTAFERVNNLHSGFDFFHRRMWQAERVSENSITFRLSSPSGDQGFPGNATIRVTYTLEYPSSLRICYNAISDADTVFNLTNHSYFNLAGHDHPEKAMSQTLMLPARHFTPSDAQSIPTGEVRGVDGTPMDFRKPKPLGQDIDAAYEALKLQDGYDHNFEVFCAPCAILSDPESGRTMAVTTDCPGVQLYTANGTKETGKGGIRYSRRSGVCLETQFYPDAVNHPEWKQPFTKANTPYHSETVFRFSW